MANIATYVGAANGYIIDVPVLLFTPDGGDTLVFDRLTSASVNNGANNIPINGGWSSFPLAVIDTDKTVEFTFECADFDQRLFAVANGTSVEDETEGETRFERVTIGSDSAAILPDTVETDSVRVAGFEADSEEGVGKFVVTAVSGDPASTKIAFSPSDVSEGQVLEVVYRVAGTGAKKVVTYTNAPTVMGEMMLIYPVYAGADKGSGVIGKLIYTLYKVRATALPGFNNSYKSASTYGATFTGLDPRRPDKAMNKLAWYPNE